MVDNGTLRPVVTMTVINPVLQLVAHILHLLDAVIQLGNIVLGKRFNISALALFILP